MSADALELALALHLAPIQRFALRDRPLPANIGDVLQLASAMQPQVATAAARYSETEATIVEAVRFYLHQVLFEPGTDAYRILGLQPEADFKQVRQHHVWLQRWLHPDRRGEDWEAALATKVNWAWQQLRSEASRAKYDRSRKLTKVTEASESRNIELAQAPAWREGRVEPRRNWVKRTLVGSVLALCVVVIFLAATRQDRVDPDVLAALSSEADSGIRPRLPFSESSHSPSKEPASNPATVTPASIQVDATPQTASPVSQSGQPAATTTVAVSRESHSIDPEPFAGTAREPEVTQRLEAGRPVSSSGLPPAQPLEARRKESTEPAGSLSVATDNSAMSARQQRRAARAAYRIEASAQASVPQPARATPAQEISGSSSDMVNARTPRRASTNTRNDAVTAAETAGRSEPNETKSLAAAELQRSIEGADVANEIERSVPIEPDSSNVESLADAAQPTMPLAAPAQPAQPVQQAAVLRPPTAAKERASLVRFELARARVRSMVSYFGSANTAPPKWNDEQGRNAVARERMVLQQRSGELGVSRFVLDPPVWQMSDSAVSLNAKYHVDVTRSTAESGRLRLDMVWNEDNWKITRIELAPGT